MTTWSFKALFTALSLTLLANCDQGQGYALLERPAAPKAAMRESAMDGAQFMLSAPTGFCIDQSSLSRRFALMARCDVMGHDGESGGSPLAIITASISSAPEGTLLPNAEQKALALGLSDISNIKRFPKALVFSASGTPPNGALAQKHWRASALIGEHLVGFALYAPEGSAALSQEGADLLIDLVTETRRKN